jgi:protein phosphatase 1 regulatory subunit 7
LCLRQNHVSHLDPGDFWLLTELEELDLYDNKVKTVGDALNHLSKLSWVKFVSLIAGRGWR